MFGGTKKLWLVALFSIVLIVLVNLAWWIFYDKTEAILDGQLGRRLALVANTGAMRITAADIEALMSDDFQAFVNIVDILEEIRLSDSLSEVFILDENYRYLATTSYEADSTYLLAPLNGRFIDSFFYSSEENALVTESYQTGSIYLKSAFVPLPDSLGLVVAVLGVEAPVDFFESLVELKNNLYFSSLLSVLAGLIFGIIFLLVQRSLNQAEARLVLSETHSHLGRMVAVISHEIKNPLMIIRGSAERLKKFLAKENKHPEESDFIIEEVDRLNQIVTGYLSFARGTIGGILAASQSEPIKVAGFMAKMKADLEQKYADQKIEWIGDNSPPGLVIHSYPRVLRQILLNLLINGAEACLSAEKPLKLGISILEQGEFIELRVVDFGPGIPKRKMKKLFEPFYTTRQQGSGLGLYLTLKIVEELKGRIDIQSEPGEKTEFIIYLPKEPNQ
ncbi:MAG: HAMP domain-containing histidine kinase [candidate division Zixibacteria bacterium]|nr:HAMP domain-containing histidine kinase [candidate division Zixibacteria bacterium]